MSGEANKIHAANSNSSESNIWAGEVSKWKTTSANDDASRPLKMDSVKVSSNKKGPTADLSPIEEVDLVDHFHFYETINRNHNLKTQTQGRIMETSSLLVEADVSLDTTGV